MARLIECSGRISFASVILLGLALAVSCSLTEAAVTAYWTYDADIYPNALADTGLLLVDQITDPCDPNGSNEIDPTGGQPGYGGALVSTPVFVNLWAANPQADYPMYLTTPPDEGTIEMWLAPAWNGTNQGGSGIGAVETAQFLYTSSGLQGLGVPGLQLLIFNNGAPDDGGQLFAFWNDGEGGVRILNNSGPGTTSNWVADEWHHVAFCWSPHLLGLFVDGQVVRLTDRPSAASMHDKSWAFFLFGHNVASGPYATWDGKVDELVFWDVSRYQGPYTPPGPLADPASCANAWELGYGVKADINQDCIIDLNDFSVIFTDWMRCNDPVDSQCE